MTDDTTAPGGLSPRAAAFYAARNVIIAECRQRKTELDRELTARLKALRAEYESATTYQFTVRLSWNECPGLGIDHDTAKDLTVRADSYGLAEDRAQELAEKHNADGWEIIGDGVRA
jgi:hypothetical protein